MPDDGTASLQDDEQRERERRRQTEPALVLVMNAARPLQSPECVSLVDIDEVSLGRGAEHRVVVEGQRRLRVDLADAAASTSHARLVRAPRGWAMSDDHSKNGTVVNGRRVPRADLGLDDLLEIGSTFLMLRRDAVAPRPAPAALRTLNGALARQLQLLARVARSKLPVLLVGETGTGKEVLARMTHSLSARTGTFVAVNCGAIPKTLVESELFGARKGAFSGAQADRAGTVVEAHGGTLFLDEIAELPEASQPALLRVLQEGEVVALGSSRPVRVDVRVLAATHRDLREQVAAGRFRQDLHARLRGHVVTLPPLRSRREDIGILCADLLQRAAGERAARVAFSRPAARALLRYDWPHNVRELEQVLTRAVALLDGDEIQLAHLPEELTGAISRAPAPQGVTLLDLVRRHAGNLSAVARALGTSRSQVQRLVRRENIDLATARGELSADDDGEG